MVYSMFKKMLIEDMKERTVPYDRFIAMATSPISTSSLQVYSKDWLPRRRRYLDKYDSLAQICRTLVLVFWTSYLLILPTWLSAMTAYQATMVPRFPLDNNISVPKNDLDFCDYVISEGERIGLVHDACISKSSFLYDAVEDCMFALSLVTIIH